MGKLVLLKKHDGKNPPCHKKGRKSTIDFEKAKPSGEPTLNGTSPPMSLHCSIAHQQDFKKIFRLFIPGCA
jgi:hypothetical protein